MRTLQCYYCGQLFDTKEKLYDHLEVHSKTSDEKKTKKRKKKKRKKIEGGESSLSEDEILEQFKESKIGEPSRMSSKG